jgi:hypothetical protein
METIPAPVRSRLRGGRRKPMSTHQFVIEVEVDDDRVADAGTLADDPSEWTMPDLLLAQQTGLATGDIVDYTFDPHNA